MIRKLYKRNIKHIAFDLDGVLIDSIALMEKSWIFSMKFNDSFFINASFSNSFTFLIYSFSNGVILYLISP